MLLPLSNHQFSLPSKTLLNPSSNPFVFFLFPSDFPLTHLTKNHKNPSKPVSLRVSATAIAADTKPAPQSAIKRIADKLRSLGYVEDEKEESKETLIPNSNSTSPGEIFVPLPTHLPKHRVGHTIDSSWSTPENPVPDPGSGSAIRRFNELRREVLKEKVREREKRKGEERERVPTIAELTVPAEELRRLRELGIGVKKKLKVGKAGITEGIVNGIHERWRRTELVKIACEDFCKMNMKRTHDLLERKTGGLVIWRSGSNIILYRGANYKYPYFDSADNANHTSVSTSADPGIDSGLNSVVPKLFNSTAQAPIVRGVGSPNRVRFQLPGEVQFTEEADRMLDGLGPRFTDWWGYEPLPIDADLLPAVVPGYRRPFRLLPYGVKPLLTNDEMTVLKRLGRPLPCHFALGRNRKLQGLAASIVKLWEKCEIAKVAVKRGVQNTNSELMAEELKQLTGGIMLSRDKEYIVLYRGKDFLPAAVSSAIAERRNSGIQTEKHKVNYSSSVMTGHHKANYSSSVMTGKHKANYSSSVMTGQVRKLGTVEGGSEDGNHAINDQKLDLISEQRKPKSKEAAIKRTSTKLDMALANKARAEELLAELEKEEIPQQPEIDKEGITEEERYMLRKVGLRMKPFLLLGRRGVFDGTVENMHLHWKYRELVKIICSARSIEEIHGIARALEAESGGILVAVERVSKGYAIIVYRGKNYKRPACLRPQTLLNKREALKRSIEAQRRESLKLHVLKLNRSIDELKHQLAKDKERKTSQSAKASKLQLVNEQEMKKMQFTDNKVSDTELETNNGSNLTTPCDEENLEAREGYGAGSTSFKSNDAATDSAGLSQETSSLSKLQDFSLKDNGKEEGVSNITEQQHLSKLELDEPNISMGTNSEGGDADSTTGHDNPMNKITSVESTKCEIKSSQYRAVEYGSSGMPSRAVWLSNKDRLLLRKQALMMKKRPVLAVGKSNIVSGLAKAIKAHFQKHPLAIVNIKGRAEGTSVQEVVLELEQATGAILVSQEPSKVILYRGWGAVKERRGTIEKNKAVMRETSAEMRETSAVIGSGTHPVVSPELMSAIRIECGLSCKQQEHEVS